MQIEVHRQTKPPLQRRPIVVSSVFMVLVGALATQMSFSRAADPLGRTLWLIELSCSLRPPRGFVQHTGLVGPEWRIQPFEANTAPWGHAELAVWYTSAEHPQGAEPIAHAILEQMRAGAAAGGPAASLIHNRSALLGTANAYEIRDPLAGLVVRARKLPTRGYLAISVSADTPIDNWYDTFDATCRTVQIAP